MQHNVLAMSGRAVEAAGDVNTLLLDKTGTITFGNRQATEFSLRPGVSERELADAAQLSSLADETPGRPLDRRAGQGEVRTARPRALRAHEAQFIPFTAQTRMSGVNLDGREIRKGAAGCHRRNVRSRTTERCRQKFAQYGRAHRHAAAARRW